MNLLIVILIISFIIFGYYVSSVRRDWNLICDSETFIYYQKDDKYFHTRLLKDASGVYYYDLQEKQYVKLTILDIWNKKVVLVDRFDSND